ncbi:MAG: dTDP-4-dehydrorhamnose 3,5-epimerase family protein [Nitrospirae bacterium]|nr:dTDP-4-dehydrorhamnose 3,5-epimerase family protein [Nitrospirota bacterium]MCL5976721.1 dTDP-4-dehydrorhamnose 3,5-epimerase family protein [Nitrospirota bacterium]
MDIIKGEIDGVVIKPLKRIPDERGTIMHGVRRDNILNDFGEVYFKKLYFGVINGWHVHERLILNYICISGMIKLVLYDMREDSPTKGNLQEIFFGDDNYCLAHIPSGVANASKGIWSPYSILANVASEPHDPCIKYLRIGPHSNTIPYNWERKDF